MLPSGTTPNPAAETTLTMLGAKRCSLIAMAAPSSGATKQDHAQLKSHGGLRLIPIENSADAIARIKKVFPEATSTIVADKKNPSQYGDLARFTREQDLLRRLASESVLPVLELDTSDGDIQAACERVADWMSETGGLWPREDATGTRGTG